MRILFVLLLFLLPNPAWTGAMAGQKATQKTAQKSVERIITLAPNLTELVFSAGLGDKLIATDWSSNYPPEVKNLPKVGDVNSLSYELILSLQPGLVLAWQDGISAQVVSKLRELGLQVEVFALQNLDDIPKVIKHLAQYQTSAQPGLVAEHLEHILRAERLKTTKQLNQAQQETFFYQIWDKPLISINEKQFISQTLQICGLQNVMAGEQMLAAEISQEEVLRLNPDWILLSANSKAGKSWQANWQKFAELSAVKNRQVVIFGEELGLSNDVLHRPTERLIRAIPTICEKFRGH